MSGIIEAKSYNCEYKPDFFHKQKAKDVFALHWRQHTHRKRDGGYYLK